jgi:hypothetical protein
MGLLHHLLLPDGYGALVNGKWQEKNEVTDGLTSTQTAVGMKQVLCF